jgi:simple sugar transport system permease protein
LAADLGQSTVALGLGFLIGALLMIVFGYDPVKAYPALLRGGFGSSFAVLESLAFSTPLMLTAVTFAVGVRGGLFNIGAEGQMYVGAIGAVAVGGALTMPPGLHLAAATGAAMLFGAALSVPAALLKMFRGVHEVVSTIMLNFVALWLVTYLVTYQLGDPSRAERAIPAQLTARYSVLGGTLTAAFFVAVAFAVITFVFLWHTRIGYEVRLVGNNPETARYAGISARKTALVSFVVGGLAAGLTGATQILGRPPSWTLFATMGPVRTLGFEGIGVALIARNHPLAAIVTAIFYGGLQNGGRLMEYEAAVPTELVTAINGILIIALAVPSVVGLIRRRRA